MQYAPDLLPYIKERIDQRRDAHGQYFLTGSQNLLLTEQVTESLAGRAAMLRLLPVSQREESARTQDPLPWESSDKRNHLVKPDLWKNLLRAGFPELVAEPGRDISLLHSSYVSNLPGARRPRSPPGGRPDLVPELLTRTRRPRRPTVESHRRGAKPGHSSKHR